MKSLTYIEVDVDYCANTYGVLPCTASIPATGSAKCFNSIATCQDREHFVNEPVTLRFGLDQGYLPDDIECIPSLMDVSFTPATISLGEDLGQRATLNVRFKDHRHSDVGPGFDKYVTERSYDPFKQGSMFGKFRARQMFVRNRPIRLIRGLVGQTLDQMETRHYLIEDFDGPTPQGVYTLVAKDVLKLADGDRAQAPRISNGFLTGNLSAGVTSFNVGPSGVGNAEYPASGYVAIGGEEIVSFTRTNDAFTIVRGQFGTSDQAHESEDRVQLCLVYQSDDPAVIIEDLLREYAGIPDEWITLSIWLTETQTFLQRLYSACIAEPTDVRLLVSELIEQAALAMWWDDQSQQIRLQVLRQIVSNADIGEDNTMEGTLSVKEQPSKRITQIWTYYGQRNPLRPIDEPDNFRSTLATVDPQTETDYGAISIKKVFSRWIPAFGQQVAERLNNIQLARFRTPPRLISFETFRYDQELIELGAGYNVTGWSLQAADGSSEIVPVQVVRLNPKEDRYSVEAEEANYVSDDPDDLVDRVIIIDSNINSINLRDLHDSIYPDPIAGGSPSESLTVIVNPGVVVGSTSTSIPGLTVGSWPVGFPIRLEIYGRIQGRGGNGGNGAERPSSSPGLAGGTAFYSRFPISVVFGADADIWGGGGGGGGGRDGGGGGIDAGGGGGGAGQNPGTGGFGIGGSQNGQIGTQTAGGAGGADSDPGDGTGGNGGGPGLSGSAGGDGVSGGAAGNAIDGLSFITVLSGTADRRGPEIN